MSKCFAFGCSMTNHHWASWADLIGSNFDEFYNCARGGACNTFASNRLIELLKVEKLNPETDYVVIGLTGFNRYSYMDEAGRWHSPGDIKTIGQQLYNEEIPPWAKDNSLFNINKWSYTLGLYHSYIAVNTMKNMLISNNIQHKIIMALDNSYYRTHAPELGIREDFVKLVNDIYTLTDVKYSLQEYCESIGYKGINFKDMQHDGHPTQEIHYQYLKKFLPEFDTDKTKNYFDDAEKTFQKDTLENQMLRWESFSLRSAPNPRRYSSYFVGG